MFSFLTCVSDKHVNQNTTILSQPWKVLRHTQTTIDDLLGPRAAFYTLQITIRLFPRTKLKTQEEASQHHRGSSQKNETRTNQPQSPRGSPRTRATSADIQTGANRAAEKGRPVLTAFFCGDRGAGRPAVSPSVRPYNHPSIHPSVRPSVCPRFNSYRHQASVSWFYFLQTESLVYKNYENSFRTHTLSHTRARARVCIENLKKC